MYIILRDADINWRLEQNGKTVKFSKTVKSKVEGRKDNQLLLKILLWEICVEIKIKNNSLKKPISSPAYIINMFLSAIILSLCEHALIMGRRTTFACSNEVNPSNRNF